MLHISTLKLLLETISEKFTTTIARISGLQPIHRPKETNIALNRLYILVNQSILAGEYIEDQVKVEKDIEEAKTYLTILLTQVEQEVTDQDISGLFYTFITVVQNCLNSYSSMIIKINNHYLVNNDIYINRDYDRAEISSQSQILVNKHSRVNYEDFDNQKTYMAYEILLINIHLSLIDLTCNPNEKLLHKLNTIEDKLNTLYNEVKLKPFEFIFSIREKAKFLKLKVLIRLYQIQKGFGSDLKIIQESKLVPIDELIDEIEFPELKSFLEYSYQHYIDTDENAQKILTRYRSIPNTEDNYFLRHLRIKYLKDLKKDRTALEILVKKFDVDYQTSDTHFNHYAKGVSLNYANNNLFSFILENLDIKYSEALNHYENIKRVSIETGIKNYFPDLRLLKYLVLKLNNLFEQVDALKEIQTINIYLEKCKELIESYKKNINWTKYNHSLIYQLPFNECIFQNSFTKKARLRHFFTASTVVLPLDKEQNNLEYIEYHNQIKVFSSIKNTMNNLAVESLKLEGLNEDLANKDVKYIEILGIFCAISTFVSAAILSIITDKNGGNGSDSFTFLLSTGIIMFSFLGLLIYIINKKSVSKKFSIVLLLILIMLIITCNNITK
ncbi:hypothetical protein ABDJ41_08130 [Pedobacter sp. ASV1-7]|uniref:hypothetical protein n=1 Tax=Pedobacter sp. ASV1-7 TaxID=3145237 RepID=UPI0032E9342A